MKRLVSILSPKNSLFKENGTAMAFSGAGMWFPIGGSSIVHTENLINQAAKQERDYRKEQPSLENGDTRW